MTAAFDGSQYQNVENLISDIENEISLFNLNNLH